MAFATFMPEISALNKETYEEAQSALRFLVKTARHVKDPKDSQRPFTIELVGGSRLQGIWNALTDEDVSTLAVNRLDTATALSELLEKLRPVAACANETEGIQLALEMEPGPLFTLDPFGGVAASTPSLLFDLCNLIDTSKDANLKQVLGVNLDIAHWAFLSGIKLEWLNLPENRVVSERIVHAHISDHSKGHFCDNAVGVCHPSKEFRPWLEFLSKLSKESRDGRPRYSGFVSCEMEACKCAGFVKQSEKNVRDLLSGLPLSW